jgi:hypothetical protein
VSVVLVRTRVGKPNTSRLRKAVLTVCQGFHSIASREVRSGDAEMPSEGQRKRDEDDPMQDLIQDYASDLKKLREVFQKELTATADELSKALGIYAHRGEAALASFMEKASARGLELEVSATARLNQFCGNGSLPGVDDIPLTLTPTNAEVLRIAAAAEQAVADGLHVESESNHKPQPAARLPRINRDRPLEEFHFLPLGEHIETAHSSSMTDSPVS